MGLGTYEERLLEVLEKIAKSLHGIESELTDQNGRISDLDASLCSLNDTVVDMCGVYADGSKCLRVDGIVATSGIPLALSNTRRCKVLPADNTDSEADERK